MTYSLEDIAQRAYTDINNYPSRYSVKNESEALAKLINAYSVYKQKSDIYRPIYDEYTEYENIIKKPFYGAYSQEQDDARIKRRELQPYLDEALENMQNAEVYLYAWGLVLDHLRGLEDNALNSSATTNLNRYYKEAQNVYYDKKAQTVNTSVTKSVSASQTGASLTGNKKMLFLAIAAGLLLLIYGES